MLILYIRVVALLELMFTAAKFILGPTNGWLMITEPRAGLSSLEFFITGDYSSVQLSPAIVSVFLFVLARWIVGTVRGLITYLVFEGLYLLGWGSFNILLGVPHTLGDIVNYPTVVLFLASAIPFSLAVQSLVRLRTALALAWRANVDAT